MAVAETEPPAVLGPSWIAHYKTEDGQDFLGIRAVATNIVSYLLPAITTITPRARYYAFYVWLLAEYGRSHPEGMSLSKFIKRREQIFVLASLAWYQESERRELGLIGSEKLTDHWNKHYETGQIPLTVDDYLRAARGGYGQYGSVMQTLELTRTTAGGAIEILPKGQRLAESFAAAIQATRYHRVRAEFDTAEAMPVDVLREYGERCHLGALAAGPDAEAVLDILFAFDKERTLPNPDSDVSTVTNMKGALGMILEILDQSKLPFSDNALREAVAYGLCDDYPVYQPSAALRPFVAHSQMFQLRSYYDYALYALWAYFLYWLRVEGPDALEGFGQHLSATAGLEIDLSSLSLDFSLKPVDVWQLQDWYDFVLDASGVPDGNWEERCAGFARQSNGPLSEANLWRSLAQLSPGDGPVYFTTATLLLSALYLRLSGLEATDTWGAWRWARTGGARRRSMALYVHSVDRRRVAGSTVLDLWLWMVRDYVVAQHTIAALEKWQQRKANTFHFNFEQGVFEWVADDVTGFSGSRFRQAYDMLADLGLFEVNSDGQLSLTERGEATLDRVRESCGG